jgi:hypothetical protein
MNRIKVFFIFLILIEINSVFGQTVFQEKFSIFGAFGGGYFNLPKDSIITERAVKGVLFLRLGAMYNLKHNVCIGLVSTRAFPWGNVWPDEIKRSPYFDITLCVLRPQKIQIFRKYFKNKYLPPIQYNHLLLFSTTNQHENNGKLVITGIGFSNYISYLPSLEIRLLPKLNAYYTPFSFFYNFNVERFNFENRPTLHLRYFFHDSGKTTLSSCKWKPIGKINKQRIQKIISDIL